MRSYINNIILFLISFMYNTYNSLCLLTQRIISLTSEIKDSSQKNIEDIIEHFKFFFDNCYNNIKKIRKNTGIVFYSCSSPSNNVFFNISKDVFANIQKPILIHLNFELKNTIPSPKASIESFTKTGDSEWVNPSEEVLNDCFYSISINDKSINNIKLFSSKESFQLEKKSPTEVTDKRKGSWGLMGAVSIVLTAGTWGVYGLIELAVLTVHQMTGGYVPNWTGNDWSEQAGPSFNPFKGMRSGEYLMNKLKDGVIVSSSLSKEFKDTYTNYLSSVSSGQCMYSDRTHYPTDIVNKNGGKQFFSNNRITFYVSDNNLSKINKDLEIKLQLDNNTIDIINSIHLKVEVCSKYFHKQG